MDSVDGSGDEITESIRSIIPAETFLVGIAFQDIDGMVGVMLEKGKGFEQSPTAGVNVQLWLDSSVGIAEQVQDLGPALGAIGVGRAQGDAQSIIMGGDGLAVVPKREKICTGKNAVEKTGGHPYLRAEFKDQTMLLATNGVWKIGTPMNHVTGEHLLDGRGVTSRDPFLGGMFVHDDQIVVAIIAAEEENGVMGVAIIESGNPFDPFTIVEVLEDVNIRTKVGKELAGGEVPIAVEPGGLSPAGGFLEDFFVLGVGEFVIVHHSRNVASAGFVFVIAGKDVGLAVPNMTDPARVGGGINAGPPIGLGSAVASFDVVIFLGGESGGLLDADDVVFEPEIAIDILLGLEMAGDDAGAIGEFEGAGLAGKFIGGLEHLAAEIVKIFAIGLSDFAEEEAFEARAALAIVGAHLGDEPVRFSTPARAAEADRSRAVRMIAATGGGAGGELARLEDDGFFDEVLHLIGRTSGGRTVPEIPFEFVHNASK